MLSAAGIKDSLFYPPKHETLMEYILYHRRSLIKSTFSFLHKQASYVYQLRSLPYPTPPYQAGQDRNSGQVFGQVFALLKARGNAVTAMI
jgi:hypothetical protein